MRGEQHLAFMASYNLIRKVCCDWKYTWSPTVLISDPYGPGLEERNKDN